jgi:hypothetical protein
MFEDNEECFRLGCRAQWISWRNTLFGRRSGKLRFNPQRVEQLPWPRNLFGECVSIAELMAKAAESA